MNDTEFKWFGKNILSTVQKAEAQALETAANYVEGEAIVRAPVDTGNLRGSITHEVDTGAMEATVSTNVEYASYVEEGTSRQAAQPYLRPALDENVQEIEKMVGDILGKTIGRG